MKSTMEWVWHVRVCLGDHEHSYHLFQYCSRCQLLYSKIPFILCDKCYYTIQNHVLEMVYFNPYRNPPFTYTNPLENGQVRPKSYIVSERPHLWQRNVPFFSNFFLEDVAIRVYFEPHLYIDRTGC